MKRSDWSSASLKLQNSFPRVPWFQIDTVRRCKAWITRQVRGCKAKTRFPFASHHMKETHANKAASTQWKFLTAQWPHESLRRVSFGIFVIVWNQVPRMCLFFHSKCFSNRVAIFCLFFQTPVEYMQKMPGPSRSQQNHSNNHYLNDQIHWFWPQTGPIFTGQPLALWASAKGLAATWGGRGYGFHKNGVPLQLVGFPMIIWTITSGPHVDNDDLPGGWIKDGAPYNSSCLYNSSCHQSNQSPLCWDFAHLGLPKRVWHGENSGITGVRSWPGRRTAATRDGHTNQTMETSGNKRFLVLKKADLLRSCWSCCWFSWFLFLDVSCILEMVTSFSFPNLNSMASSGVEAPSHVVLTCETGTCSFLTRHEQLIEHGQLRMNDALSQYTIRNNHQHVITRMLRKKWKWWWWSSSSSTYCIANNHS